MNIYTIALVITCVLSIGRDLGRHGQSEVIKHDFRATLVGQLVVIFLILKATNTI